MYDRVLRLYDPQNPSGTSTQEWFNAGLGAITLGNELLRLRYWHAAGLPAELKTAVEDVIGAFRSFFSHPQVAVTEVRDVMKNLAQHDPGSGRPERLAWARVLGALEEIDIYLARHPRLTLSAPVPATPAAHGTGDSDPLYA